MATRSLLPRFGPSASHRTLHTPSPDHQPYGHTCTQCRTGAGRSVYATLSVSSSPRMASSSSAVGE